MNTRRLQLVGLAGLAAMIACGVLSWHWNVTTRKIAALTAEWDRKARALDDAIRAAAQNAEEATRAATAATATLAAREKTPASASESPKTEAKPASALAPQRTLSIAHIIRHEPDAQVLFLASQRAALAATYGPLFRELGLSAEHAARVQDNVIRQREQMMDLEEIQRQGEIDATLAQKLRGDEMARYEAAQRELLGEDGYQRWREYERTSFIRGIVSAIAGVAVVENAPFTAQQADLLVQAMARASESYRRGGHVRTTDIDWNEVEAQARAILSPEQFEIFHTMDPGPTRPGLLQTRLYAEVERANDGEKAKRNRGEPAEKPGS